MRRARPGPGPHRAPERGTAAAICVDRFRYEIIAGCNDLCYLNGFSHVNRAVSGMMGCDDLILKAEMLPWADGFAYALRAVSVVQ